MNKYSKWKRFLWIKYPPDMPLHRVLFQNQSIKIWRIRLVWWDYGKTYQLQYYGRNYKVLRAR